MTAAKAAKDGERIQARASGQDWVMSWHPPGVMPDGRPHGATGICVTSDGGIVLVSPDGQQWDLPGGRPEGEETLEETFRRELSEEACATARDARLLGFCRSECVEGPELGLVLVRSWWWAEVDLGPWEPRFETTHRRVVAATEVLDLLPVAWAPITSRAFRDASIES